jgi:phage tail sheath gpL-like
MTVPFSTIPGGLRVPLFYAEIDPSHANSASQLQRTLLIGQVTADGTLTPNVPTLSRGTAEARASAGPGSMLAGMAAAYRANDPAGEVWYLPLADDGAGVAATGAVTFTGTSTAAGTVHLYVAGILVNVAIASGQTAAQVATTVAAAIGAAGDLPVTAAVDGVVTTRVNLTAKNKGLVSNDIDVRLNYFGASGGETLPSGITAAVTAMANGATNPALATALANLQDMPFDVIVLPYTDPTSLAAMKAFLSDTAGRWSWTSQVYGHCFAAYRGTAGQLATFGTALNDQHLTVVGFNDSPSPKYSWAAAVAGAAAVSLRSDPAVPLQTLAVAGILAPPIQSRCSLSQRNTLLFDGISTFRVDGGGGISIENLITTYQLNGQGQPDDSYLQVETMFTLMLVLRRLQTAITSKFARMKLAADGVRLGPGSRVVTPSTIRAELIAQYRQLESEGFVQNSAAFSQGLVVEKNAGNPNRVDVLWPGTLVSQLRVFALLAQFRLS